MSTNNSRFGLSIRRASRAQAPTVHVFLQRIVRQANGMLAVTPACASLAEIEEEIETLKAELESVLQQARQAFAGKREPAVPS